MKSSPTTAYVRALLGTVAAVLLFAAGLNTLVNPLRVTPTPWTLDSLDPHRVVEHYERTAKAGYVRNADWDAAIFGSSRLDLGINPAHPALAGRRTANLSLSAGKLTENLEMLRYTLEREQLDLVIFGVDLLDLAEPVRVPKTDFYASPLARTGNPLDRELQYLFGLNALKASFTTLGRALRDIPSEHLPNGHWVWDRPPRDLRTDAERKSFPQAFGLSRNRRTALTPLNPDKIAMTREILRLCRDEGARLVLVLPPNHAVLNAAFFLLDDPDPNFAAERRFLAELIAENNRLHPDAPAFAVWDFDDFHPLNCETLPTQTGQTMRDWLDTTHARPSLGNLKIEAILGVPQPRTAGTATYGRRLTPENLDAALADRRAGYQRFRNENPADIAWIESTLDELRAKASTLIFRTDD